VRGLAAALVVAGGLAVSACAADGPEPIPKDQSRPVLDAIGPTARDDGSAALRRARELWGRDCFDHDQGRVYCLIEFSDYPGAFDHYCTRGYSATRDGQDVRPETEVDCGRLTDNPDPLGGQTTECVPGPSPAEEQCITRP
jgi:hypothetical protein